MKGLFFVVAALFCATASAIPNRAVEVGGDPNFDACGGSGIVTATTTLFTTDSRGFIQYDVINVNQQVFACDSAENEEYVGVVFGAGDCGVSSSIPKRQPYKGSCKSGWVKKLFFELTAGRAPYPPWKA